MSFAGRYKDGFTLIELLVVIAIIGILSSVLITRFSVARARARDAVRQEDIHSIINALELMYHTDGKFSCHTYSSSASADFMKPYVDRGFLGSTPHDPLNNGTNLYWYSTYGTTIGGGCKGNVTHIDVDFETLNQPCPFGKFKVGNPYHCHIFYPHPLPTSDPYHIMSGSEFCISPDPDCHRSYEDTINEY